MEQILSEANNLVISIDAMGGDNSPRVVIEGLALAAKKNPDAKFLLFGDETKVLEHLNNYPDLKKSARFGMPPKSSVTTTSLHRLSATAIPACIWQ